MMPYLDAALAFALTMLAVATLVTSLVRLLRNTAKVRRQGLQDMLDDFFTTEFKPVIQRELNRLKTATTDEVFNRLNEALANLDHNVAINRAETVALVDMTTEELLERLKRSEYGQKMLTELGNKAQAVFDELGRRYEVVGYKATESFREHSKWWAFGIALFLALVINIDSIHIANTYINNAAVSQAIIAQKDAFVADYNDLAKTLEAEQGKETFTKADLEQAFKDSQAQLNVVTGSGFPVGWSYFPHSYFKGAPQAEWGSSQDFKNRANLLGWLTWALGILLTGFLAGLGGPFWYDVVAGITRVVQGTRAAAKQTDQATTGQLN
jgi:hypothetical protein